MAKFVSIVTVADPKRTLHTEDWEAKPWGSYIVHANDEEEALDKFHENIPIKVLDDFDIEVTQVKEEIF